MAEKNSRKKESSKKGKGASGKAAKVSNVKSRKEEKRTAGIKTNPEGSYTRDIIAAIVLIAVSLFTIIALITEKTGKAGIILSMFLKGTLGAVAYIVPFYFIIYSILMLTQRAAHMNSRTAGFTVLLVCDLAMLNSVRFSAVQEDTSWIYYIKMAFQEGSDLNSAGLIGMILGRLAYMLVDVSGMIIAGVVVLIICFILLADTPVSQFFDRLRIRKNQKKFHLMPEKTETGRSSSVKDTIEIDPSQISESSSGKTGKKKKAGKNDGDFSEPDSESVRKRTGPKGTELPLEEDEIEEEEEEAYSFEDKLRQLKNKAENSGWADFFSGFSSRRAETDTLPIDKKQILDYLEDDDLFGSGEKPDRIPDMEEDGWEEMIISSGRTPDASETDVEDRIREDGLFGLDEVYGEVPVKEPEPDAFEQFLWSELQQDKEDNAQENLPSEEAEAEDISDALFQQEQEALKGSSSAASANRRKTTGNGSTSGKKAAAAAAAGSLEEVNQAVEKAAAKPEKQYVLPPLTLLNAPQRSTGGSGKAELREKAAVLEKVLRDFGVDAAVINVNRGPSITRYEIQPATGVKVSSIVRLSDDIALNLRARSLRIEAPIPGKAAIGIEVQNDSSDLVSVREMIESKEFRDASSKISFAVGKDISGNCVIADLKKMPHMLIAGSTGSGKSVCINSILMSILYHSTPDEVKLILIDPKVVELGNYNGIPHMLIPVVTDPAKAAAALMWAVQEMEARYKKFAKEQVKNLAGFNKKMRTNDREEEVMPQIVIIIDELADLMMAAAKQVEESICRLAQLARAAGMHMIVATQRPSVDVVTGLIKANVPSRIAFAVSSQVDSRTILDRGGAEKLVGNGDMLFSPLGSSHPQRLQGPFVSDEEVTAVIDFWKEQAGDDLAPDQIQQQVMNEINTVNTDFGSSAGESEDELYQDAVKLVVDSGHASASMLQRRFRIGYNRAGRLIDEMEAKGIIGPSEGSRPRKVLVSKEELEAGADEFEAEEAADDAEFDRMILPEEE